MDRLGWQALGSSFACACGQTHRLPIEVCHVGADAAVRLAFFARERCGDSAIVVCDENTRHASSEAVSRALSAAGRRVEEVTYGNSLFEATEELAESVAAREGDFYVGVGAGTLSDLAKYAGDKRGKPVLLYPTAASMNGYTSALVALKIRGLKRTLPCAPAIGVFADPTLVAAAPQRMTAAGVGDFLSKCSSSADWFAGHFLRGGYYCERPREFFDGLEEKVIGATPRVAVGDPRAVAVVLDALLLAGLSMVVAGSSAPASGGEHLISHYLDMRHALYGTPNDLHGTQVGVATLDCLRLWEKILALDPQSLDVDALMDAQPSNSEIRRIVEEDWGPVAPEVLAQWLEKAPDRQTLRAELERFRAGFDSLRTGLLRDLLPSETIAAAIRAAGGPDCPEGLEAPIGEYQNALRKARFLRSRFTVLDLAAELGVE